MNLEKILAVVAVAKFVLLGLCALLGLALLFVQRLKDRNLSKTFTGLLAGTLSALFFLAGIASLFDGWWVTGLPVIGVSGVGVWISPRYVREGWRAYEKKQEALEKERAIQKKAVEKQAHLDADRREREEARERSRALAEQQSTEESVQ